MRRGRDGGKGKALILEECMKWCHTPAMFALMVLKHHHESQVNLGSITRPVSTGRERHRETDRQTDRR